MSADRCEICGEPAQVHTCEIHDGHKTERHLCREHAQAGGLPGVDPEPQIRQAILTCWAMLPEHRRNPQDVSTQIRHLVEQALADFQEDAAAFGFGA